MSASKYGFRSASLSMNYEKLTMLGLPTLRNASIFLLRTVFEAISAVDSLGTLIVDADLYGGILDRGFTLTHEQCNQLVALLIVDVSIASALRSLFVSMDWIRHCLLRLLGLLLLLGNHEYLAIFSIASSNSVL